MAIPPKAAAMAKGPAKERLVTELPKNNAGSEDDSDGGDGAGGNKPKPGMTSTFNPMDFLNQKDKSAGDSDKEGGDGKGGKDKEGMGKPERKAEPKRSSEEEEQYINLLHSIAEKPVVKGDDLDETRFDEVLTECIRLARKNKEWFSVW